MKPGLWAERSKPIRRLPHPGNPTLAVFLSQASHQLRACLLVERSLCPPEEAEHAVAGAGANSRPANKSLQKNGAPVSYLTSSVGGSFARPQKTLYPSVGNPSFGASCVRRTGALPKSSSKAKT